MKSASLRAMFIVAGASTLAFAPACAVDSEEATDGTEMTSGREDGIVGGHTADEGEYPVAALFDVAFDHNPKFTPRADYVCAGVIFNDRWVLTSSVCVNGHDKRNLRIGIGRRDLRQYPSDVKDNELYKVQGVFVHPEGKDLTLIELSGSYRGAKTSLVRDTAEERRLARTGASAWAVGWGAVAWGDTSAQRRYPNDLQEAEVKLMSQSQCDSWYGGRFVCASAPVARTCYGDSGSPLLVRDGKRWVALGTLYGNTSVPCAQGALEVYDRVATQQAWITACTSDTSKCNRVP